MSRPMRWVTRTVVTIAMIGADGGGSLWAAQEPAEPASSSIHQAMMALREAHVDVGLQQFQEAVSTGPQTTEALLNAATLLFYRAQEMMRNSEDQAQAHAMFTETQRVLTIALEAPAQAGEAGRIAKSQCAFLLGQLAQFVWQDPEQARTRYNEALQYFPEHPATIRALQQLLAAQLPMPDDSSTPEAR